MRLILVFLLALSFPAFGQVYKWTDAAGNVHFGTQPPPGHQEEVTIRDSKPGAMGREVTPESDIIRQSRELERRKSQQAISRASERYRERSAGIREDYEDQPDYICRGAENRLQGAKDRWQSKRRQGYSISEEQRYTQRIKDAERHRDNICR